MWIVSLCVCRTARLHKIKYYDSFRTAESLNHIRPILKADKEGCDKHQVSHSAFPSKVGSTQAINEILLLLKKKNWKISINTKVLESPENIFFSFLFQNLFHPKSTHRSFLVNPRDSTKIGLFCKGHTDPALACLRNGCSGDVEFHPCHENHFLAGLVWFGWCLPCSVGCHEISHSAPWTLLF